MKNTSKMLIALGAGLAGSKKFTDKIKSKVKVGKEKLEDKYSRINGEMEEVI